MQVSGLQGSPLGISAGEVIAAACSLVARTMGWLPFARSTSERRRCPNAMPSARYCPSPSGPRCAMMSHMALRMPRSATCAFVKPHIPHILLLLFGSPLVSRRSFFVYVCALASFASFAYGRRLSRPLLRCRGRSGCLPSHLAHLLHPQHHSKRAAMNAFACSSAVSSSGSRGGAGSL